MTVEQIQEQITGLERLMKECEEKCVEIYKNNSFYWSLGEREDLHKEWIDISCQGKQYKKEINNLLDKLRDIRQENKTKEDKKTFINSYGEATKREITTSTYNRTQNRMKKQVLRNMGF